MVFNVAPSLMVKVFVPDERSRLLKVVPVTIAGWAAAGAASAANSRPLANRPFSSLMDTSGASLYKLRRKEVRVK